MRHSYCEKLFNLPTKAFLGLYGKPISQGQYWWNVLGDPAYSQMHPAILPGCVLVFLSFCLHNCFVKFLFSFNQAVDIVLTQD